MKKAKSADAPHWILTKPDGSVQRIEAVIQHNTVRTAETVNVSPGDCLAFIPGWTDGDLTLAVQLP